MNRSLFFTAVVGLALCGCATIDNLSAMIDDGSSRRDERGPRADYDGPECKEVVPGPDFYFGMLEVSDPRRKQVLELVCLPPSEYGPDGNGRQPAFWSFHEHFPEQKPDPLLAAVMVSECVRGDFCSAERPETVGLMAFYAGLYDEPSLRSAVAALPLPERAKGAFVAAALRAGSTAKTRSEALSPKARAIFVDIPRNTFAERRILFTPYAALYDALNGAVAQLPGLIRDPAALRKQLDVVDELREKFMAKCGAFSCRYHPFFVEATVAMVEAENAAGLQLDADATAENLFGLDAHADTFANQVFTREYEKLDALHAEREAWTSMRDSQNDAMLRARFPDGEPPYLPRDTIYRPESGFTFLVPYLSKEGSGPMKGEGKIRALSPAGKGTVRVTFDDVVERYSDQDCHNTGRPIRYDFDKDRNAIIPVYDQVCSKPRFTFERRAVPPVTIPERQARRLKPGQQIDFFTLASGEGRIIDVTQGGRFLALGAVAVPVKGSELRVSSAK